MFEIRGFENKNLESTQWITCDLKKQRILSYFLESKLLLSHQFVFFCKWSFSFLKVGGSLSHHVTSVSILSFEMVQNAITPFVGPSFPFFIKSIRREHPRLIFWNF